MLAKDKQAYEKTNWFIFQAVKEDELIPEDEVDAFICKDLVIARKHEKNVKFVKPLEKMKRRKAPI